MSLTIIGNSSAGRFRGGNVDQVRYQAPNR